MDIYVNINTNKKENITASKLTPNVEIRYEGVNDIYVYVDGDTYIMSNQNKIRFLNIIFNYNDEVYQNLKFLEENNEYWKLYNASLEMYDDLIQFVYDLNYDLIIDYGKNNKCIMKYQNTLYL